ncbi:MAG TPA: hypothetical protein DHV56_13670 [Rhodobacter sp.]|nr:hypothetical protein [Rhodobacter sp.]
MILINEPPRLCLHTKPSEDCRSWNSHKRRILRSPIHPSSLGAWCGWRWPDHCGGMRSRSRTVELRGSKRRVDRCRTFAAHPANKCAHPVWFRIFRGSTSSNIPRSSVRSARCRLSPSIRFPIEILGNRRC